MIGRIVEAPVAADDGHVAASAAVHHAGFSARYRASGNSPIEGESGRRDPFGHYVFHFFIGSLHEFAGVVSGTNVGAEVNPRAAVFDQVWPALGVDFNTELV